MEHEGIKLSKFLSLPVLSSENNVYSLGHLASLVLVAALVFRFAYARFFYSISFYRFARQYGTRPARADRHWDPFFGLDFVIHTIRAKRGRYLLKDIQARFSRFGQTFTSNVLGDLLIFTDEPKNALAVLATSFADFDMGELRREATAKLLGHGIFNADGVAWAHFRALIRPSFAKKHIADLSMMERHVEHMISYLPRDGTSVDIQSYFFRLTMDIATESFFGRSINSLSSDATTESQRFSWAFDYALGTIAQKIRMGKFNWLYRPSRYDEACSCVHNYVKPIIADAIRFRQSKIENEQEAALGSSAANGMKTEQVAMGNEYQSSPLTAKGDKLDDGLKDERYIFLHEIAKHTNDEKELRDQIVNTLIAARDTTASLMSSTMFVLSRRPDVWLKLQAEVATLGGKPPTFDQIKDLKYVQYILNEALRLFPVVPMNFKFANKDTFLPRGGGSNGDQPLFVQKGQMVIWVIYSMQRREDLWGADAAEFRPERWEGLQASSKYLPFNTGPRICPGRQYALTEASYTFIRLCQAFSTIEAVSEEKDRPWTEKFGLTCAVAGGVNVRCWA